MQPAAVFEQIGQMGVGVPRHLPNFRPAAAEVEMRAFRDRVCGGGNVAVAVDFAVGKTAFQAGDAAGVVVVVVGNPDLRQFRFGLSEVIEHGFGIARIDADGLEAV